MLRNTNLIVFVSSTLLLSLLIMSSAGLALSTSSVNTIRVTVYSDLA